VVFGDIGTSVYYVPGILYGHFGGRSAVFVAMTLVVFLLLTIKYAEVAWRYPEGGGVVTVASRALHPFAGLLGGLFSMVDYYLTAAISALSGFQYLAVLAPPLAPLTVAVEKLSRRAHVKRPVGRDQEPVVGEEGADRRGHRRRPAPASADPEHQEQVGDGQVGNVEPGPDRPDHGGHDCPPARRRGRGAPVPKPCHAPRIGPLRRRPGPRMRSC
jgi:hypothetical protein